MAETCSAIAGTGVARRPRRLLLLSMPRTTSNVLVKILALKYRPNLITSKTHSYLFLPAALHMLEIGVSGKRLDDWTTEQMDQARQAYETCLEGLDALIQAAENTGDTIFVKEHAEFLFDPITRSKFLHGSSPIADGLSWKLELPPSIAMLEDGVGEPSFTSGTFLPDAFLRTWLPIFLIRHPALAYPSYYRVRRNMNGLSITGTEAEIGRTLLTSMTYSWSRKLYDWYCTQGARAEATVSCLDDGTPWPIVIDSDDYMMDHKSLIRLCEVIQLDPTKLQFSWERTSDEEARGIVPIVQGMQSTLLSSTGVIARETSSQELNITEEARKWRKDFGEPVGSQLEQLVRDAMPDYEYLRSRRLKLLST